MKTFYIYILTNKRNGTLYTGVTSNLIRRTLEHKARSSDCFSKKYQTTKLVYFESTDCAWAALAREKSLKRWRRQWKIQLIESINPEWLDLINDIV